MSVPGIGVVESCYWNYPVNYQRANLRKELGLTRKQSKKCTSEKILSKNAKRKNGNSNRNSSTSRMFLPLYFCSVEYIRKYFWYLIIKNNFESIYFRFSTAWYNRLRNKHLTEYLRSNSNELATVRFSAFCGAMLSNNSFQSQRYNIYMKRQYRYWNFIVPTH